MARWTSRSALSFAPSPQAWEGTHESVLSLSPALRSLAGESLSDELSCTVVFAGGPRLDADASPHLVLPGRPLPLVFEGPVTTQALRGQMLAYEVGGGQRALSFTPVLRGRDDRGRSMVDLRLGRTLEAGAHVAVALSPTLYAAWEGATDPGVVNFELAPWPHIEGIDCPEHPTSSGDCTFQQAPGRVVDIGDTLRLYATNPLAPDVSGSVTVIPPVQGLTITPTLNLLAVSAEWVAAQVYEVRIGALRDTDGHLLLRTAPLAVRSSGRPPEVDVASGRLTYERAPQAGLPFAAVHVDRGLLRYAAIEPGQELAAALEAPHPRAPAAYVPTWHDSPLEPLVPTARANHWARGRFSWLDPAAGRSASMAMVEFQPDPGPDSTGSVTRTLVQTTDLGVTAHVLPHGVLVWVTSLSTAQAVAAADVSVATIAGLARMTAPVSAHTDAAGLAWLPLPPTPVESQLAVRVSHGDDRAILVVDPRTAVRPGALGLPPGGATPALHAPIASVLTDRGAYRPGETVHVKVVVRTVEGEALGTLTRGAVRIALEPPGGGPRPLERTPALTRFGTADADFTVPPSAPLGDYAVTVRREGSGDPIGSTLVTVAEFRQPNVRVDLQIDGDSPSEGDTVTAHASSTYLFGAPVAGGQARWTLTREPGAPLPVRWSSYSFVPVDASPRAGTIYSGELLLDPRGRAEIPARLALDAPVREHVTFELVVRDSSGQATSAWRTFTAYPATWEPGVHSGPAWIDRGEPLDVDTVVIAHDGTPAVGRTVTARILREAWHSYWEWSAHARDDAAGTAGGFLPRRGRNQEIVHRCALVSATVPVHCTWTPDRPGTYVLEASTTDEQGRTAIASRRVYVAAPGEHPDRDPPGAPIAITPSRREWTVGEQAAVAFESPWPDAEALITVEREGVLHTERRRVHAGSVTVDLPVSPEMVPNAYVTVVLARPRSGTATGDVDLASPDLRWGAAELTVRSRAAPLDVTLAVGAVRVLPGTDVPVDVTIRDADGRGVRAELALYAVDEGTLRLTGYAAPDPTAGLLPRRPPAFAWEDLRRSLVSRVDFPALPGASGDGTDDQPHGLRDERERFDPTPLWQPHLVTDAAGRAHVMFHVPDRPAQYRVMAVAIDAGVRSGRASATVTATRPVVLRAALPRSVTTGDRFEAAVFVHNTGEQAVDADVVATIAGVPQPTHHVHLESLAEARVAEWVDAGVIQVEVRFDATVPGGIVTSTALRVPVAPRGHWLRTDSEGVVHRARDITIALPTTALPTGGEFSLTVASHPFLGLEAAMAGLATDPYEGAEALASQVLGWISLTSLDPQVRQGRWSSSEIRERGESALSRLAAYQLEGGGFGHWSASDEPDGYLSAYVLHAVASARLAGWTTPADLQDRLAAWLSQSVEGGAFTDGLPEGYDSLAAALRALAASHHANGTRITALYDQRELLTPYGQAQLAMAMEPSDRRRDALVLGAAHRVLTAAHGRVRAPDRWFATPIRTTSAVLESIARTGVAWRDAGRVARVLLDQRENGTWGGPHDTSHAIQALAAYAGRFRGTQPLQATVTLDGRTLAVTSATRFSARYTLSFATVGHGTHALRIQGEGVVFSALASRWVEPLGPSDDIARGHGTTLHRVYETEPGVPLAPGAHVHLGDLVRVRLFTYDEGAVPPFIAIRDPLPGGFDPVDQGLETTPRASLDALLGSGPDDTAIDPRGFYAMRSLDLLTHRSFDRGATILHVDHGTAGLHEYTYAIRAAAVGTFIAPPAQSEALYARGYVALSTAATLVVDP